VYESTRGNYPDQTGMQAIALGMVPAGGLFVPKDRPKIDWKALEGLSYPQLAKFIFKQFLPDFPEELLDQAASIYSKKVFDSDNPAPLKNVGAMGILELWHGPTSAFKDMALQVLPYFLGESIKKQSETEKVLILVATSGDTGKAALEGFKNVFGTEIIVFYPEGGVSVVQERQMTTTDGKNTRVAPVNGNFDQCQSAVKEIFANRSLREKFASQNIAFSSANSINWGRLLPQIIYYIWAYQQAIQAGNLLPGQPMNIVVPTGNFGNILAAYYAKEMGIPIKELICASNQNNVLVDFFESGVYNRNRPFYLTSSPSMDILISSNFERFLYDMSGKDTDKIQKWFKELQENGRFSVDSNTLANAKQVVKAGWADEASVLKVIHDVYNEYSYVLDPHTAVGVKVYRDYSQRTEDKTYTLIASTASPFKFSKTVLEGINPALVSDNEWSNLAKLSEITGWSIPEGLKGLKDKSVNALVSTKPDKISDLIQQIYLR
jgi:threonine synthase